MREKLQPASALQCTQNMVHGVLARHLQCGDGWQSRYTAMHAAMLRGELPPRYLVVEGIAGLADSLVGAVSMLYLAVLQVSNMTVHVSAPRGCTSR